MSSDLLPPGITTKQDIDEMQRLRNIINGFNKKTENIALSPTSDTPVKDKLIGTPALSQSQAKGAGKDNLMENFVNAVGSLYETAENAAESIATSNDPEIKEALTTRKISSGVKIGKWEINYKMKKINLKEEKVFDVYHSKTGDVIAESLSVYEAAHALVRLLNNGHVINSKQIKDLLIVEEKFFFAREKAKLYKIKEIRARKASNYQKEELFESRFDYSRNRAIELKRQLIIINKQALKA